MRTHPGAAPLGVALTAGTVCVMTLLGAAKQRIGTQLASSTVLADARFSFVDAALAAAVLVGLGAELACRLVGGSTPPSPSSSPPSPSAKASKAYRPADYRAAVLLRPRKLRKSLGVCRSPLDIQHAPMPDRPDRRRPRLPSPQRRGVGGEVPRAFTTSPASLSDRRPPPTPLLLRRPRRSQRGSTSSNSAASPAVAAPKMNVVAGPNASQSAPPMMLENSSMTPVLAV